MLDAALPLRASLASYCYGAPARPVSQVTPSRAEPMWKTRPIWPASAAQAADWPRLAEARGSLRHNLALKGASGEPAGRVLTPLVFHIGGHAVVHALRPARRGRLHTHHARLAALRLMEFSVSYSRSCHTPSHRGQGPHHPPRQQTCSPEVRQGKPQPQARAFTCRAATRRRLSNRVWRAAKG